MVISAGQESKNDAPGEHSFLWVSQARHEGKLSARVLQTRNILKRALNLRTRQEIITYRREWLKFEAQAQARHDQRPKTEVATPTCLEYKPTFYYEFLQLTGSYSSVYCDIVMRTRTGHVRTWLQLSFSLQSWILQLRTCGINVFLQEIIFYLEFGINYDYLLCHSVIELGERSQIRSEILIVHRSQPALSVEDLQRHLMPWPSELGELPRKDLTWRPIKYDIYYTLEPHKTEGRHPKNRLPPFELTREDICLLSNREQSSMASTNQITHLNFQILPGSDPPVQKDVIFTKTNSPTIDWACYDSHKEDYSISESPNGTMLSALKREIGDAIWSAFMVEIRYIIMAANANVGNERRTLYIPEDALSFIGLPNPFTFHLAELLENPLTSLTTEMELKEHIDTIQQRTNNLRAWSAMGKHLLSTHRPDPQPYWHFPKDAELPQPYILRSDWELEDQFTPEAWSIPQCWGVNGTFIRDKNLHDLEETT
ncbi:MAG TPA: hypothetical protein VGO47_09690, partial [Chlamydiales bacterium]|nr:hypothetical protein [Chlamydiales bacterium]